MEKKCKQCGYKWQSRVTRPKQCPSCKSRDWNKKKRPHRTNKKR